MNFNLISALIGPNHTATASEVARLLPQPQLKRFGRPDADGVYSEARVERLPEPIVQHLSARKNLLRGGLLAGGLGAVAMVTGFDATAAAAMGGLATILVTVRASMLRPQVS